RKLKIEPDQERLINLVENDVPDNSSNDPLFGEADLFLSDNSIPPGIENVADDPEGDDYSPMVEVILCRILSGFSRPSVG
nr:hypothetical protein [Tanacetum cinerariifolium]